MSKIKSNYEIISDKANDVPVTSTEYIKHGDKWLDETINGISFNADNSEPATLENSDNKKSIKGELNLSKRTFGRYDDACVLSAIANRSTDSRPAVLGADIEYLSHTYLGRDSVGIYAANYAYRYSEKFEDVTYTAKTATVNGKTTLNDVKIGMLLDTDIYSMNGYVALVKGVENNVITVDGGWYKKNRNHVAEMGIPTQKTLYTNPCDKVWATNFNVYTDGDSASAVGCEIGVNNKGNTDLTEIGGVDVVKLGVGRVGWGFRSRDCNVGIKIQDAGRASMEVYSDSVGDAGQNLIAVRKSKQSDTEPPFYYIKNNGETNRIISTHGIVSGNISDIESLSTVSRITASNINITLGDNITGLNQGRIISFIAAENVENVTLKSLPNNIRIDGKIVNELKIGNNVGEYTSITGMFRVGSFTVTSYNRNEGTTSFGQTHGETITISATGKVKLTNWTKNVINHTAESKTLNGLSFQVNEDKSILVTGTATATTLYAVGTFEAFGRFSLSGCPKGGAISTYGLRVDANGQIIARDIGITGGATLNSGTATVNIVIFAGQTVNLLFKPQVEVGSVVNTYVSPMGYDITSTSNDGTKTDTVHVKNDGVYAYINVFGDETTIESEFNSRIDVMYALDTTALLMFEENASILKRIEALEQ